MGCLYLRGNSKNYWMKYYRNGKCYRESTGTTKKTEAERILKHREGQIADGRFQGLAVEKTTFDELVSDLELDYKLRGRKSGERLQNSLAHLRREFQGMRATAINSNVIERYTEKRMNAGAKNATINRELSALKRMYNLGRKKTPPKVAMVPHIRMLSENNVRTGFFEHDEYIKMRAVIAPHLKAMLSIGYYTGMRRGEILSLKWSQVDFSEQSIRLVAGQTKNSQARIIYFDGSLLSELMKQKTWRDAEYPDCPFVVFYEGKAVKDIRVGWFTACDRAGIGRKLFHDLRRTAVRNMIRAGVPQVVAMRISGHKTTSMFNRYNIVDEQDLRSAARAMAQQFSVPDDHGHILGTVVPFSTQKFQRGNSEG